MSCGCGKREIVDVSNSNIVGHFDLSEKNPIVFLLKGIFGFLFGVLFGILALVIGIPVLFYVAICTMLGIKTRTIDIGPMIRLFSKRKHHTPKTANN